jgi:hypothetical protein
MCLSLAILAAGHIRADDPQAAEESLRKLGRRHTHVFRTTGGDPPRISLLQLTTVYVTSEMQQLPELTELRTLRLSGKFTKVSMAAAGKCRNLRSSICENSDPG